MTAQPGEGTDVPQDSDVHTTAGKLADLERRLDEAVHAGSAKAIEKQHAKGRRTARERIENLLRHHGVCTQVCGTMFRSADAAGRGALGWEQARELGAELCTRLGTPRLAEPQFNLDLVETVLDGTAARSAVIDPMDTTLAPGPDLYPALIRKLGRGLADCLAP